MSAPWEKYAQGAPADGPWSRYAQPEQTGMEGVPKPEELMTSQERSQFSADSAKQQARGPLSDSLDYLKSYLSNVGSAAKDVAMAPAGPIGGADAGLSLLTGALSPVTGSIRSFVTGEPIEKAADAVTYQPRTASGKAQAKLLGAIAQPLQDSGADVALLPLTGEAIPQAPNVRPSIVRPASFPRKPVATANAAGEVVSNAPRAGRKAGLEGVSEATPIEVARSAGYKLKPSETGGKVGAVIEGLTGSAKLEQSLVKQNQRNTDRLIREEFKLPEGPITKPVLDQAKKPHNRVYAEVGEKVGEVPVDAQFKSDISKIGRTPGTSFEKDVSPAVENLKAAYVDETRFHGRDAILKIRQLRYKSGKNIGSRDPEMQELGYAQRSIADAIEGQMERRATELGQTDLIERFRSARQELAKLHTVDAATRGGEVNAHALAKQLERGVPLSGNLKTIAKVAQDFENVTRPGRKVKGGTPVNMTDTAVAAVSTIGTGPAGMAALAARPAVRSFLTSDRYQNSLAKKGAPSPAKTAPKKRNALADH